VVADITTRKRLETQAARFSDRLASIQEQERRNLAQELHDSTVQHLVAASLTAECVRRAKGSDAQTGWDALEGSLAEATKELRTFSFLLVPPEWRRHGFSASLRWYVDGFAERAGLRAKLRMCERANDLTQTSKRAVFRVVQEALANVYRHASASGVAVELRRIKDRLHVVVTDDGCGISENPRPREGVGIRGMKLRLTHVGGRLRIGPAPNGGTRVYAVLPFA
jgi:signal transduction histidine kinase